MTDGDLRAWVTAQYEQAQEAARVARQYRTAQGNPHALFFASAVARVCALGQVLERMPGAPLPGRDVPMTPHGRKGDL